MLADILTIAGLILTSCIFLYALWIGGVALAGVFAGEKQYEASRNHTFAVITCARNEEKVIAGLLESLKAQDYPKDQYKVFAVAHNCTDHTSEVAAANGAEVFVRNSSQGYKEDALSFGLDEIERRYPGAFEYYVVFDADALVSPNFLREMNAALDATGADCAAGYYGSRNFSKNTVTKLCGMLYHNLMHSATLVHGRLGLPVDIFGSGYAVKMKWCHLVGQVSTFVTDFEFSLLLVLNRAKMIAVPKARFYAEMPETFGEALTQRRRWSYGDTQCYRKYGRTMRAAVFTHGLPALKQYIELIMNPFVSLTLVGILLLAIAAVLKGFVLWVLWTLSVAVILYYCLFLLISIVTMKKEGIPYRHNEGAFLLFPFWLTVSGYYAVTTQFMRKMSWKQTKRYSGSGNCAKEKD